jgi:hypothetical protein
MVEGLPLLDHVEEFYDGCVKVPFAREQDLDVA